jgi:hypothetical protein
VAAYQLLRCHGYGKSINYSFHLAVGPVTFGMTPVGRLSMMLAGFR